MRRTRLINFALMSAFLILCFTLTGLLGKEVMDRLNDLRSAELDTSQWELTQIQVEQLRLSRQIDTTLLKPAEDITPQDLDALRHRYRAFTNRVMQFSETSFFRTLSNSPSTAPLMMRLTSFTSEVAEPENISDQVLIALLPELAERTDQIETAISNLVRQSAHLFAEASGIRRAGFALTLERLALTTAVLVGALSVMVLMLYYQTNRSKDAIRAHEVARARLDSMIDTSLDAIMVADDQGYLLDYNPAAESIFGYKRDEVLGQHMFDLFVPPYHRAKHYEAMERYFVTGHSDVLDQGRVQLQAMRSNGVVFPAEVSAAMVHTPRGDIVVSYFRDISERLQAEKELMDARDRAEEGQRARAEMLAIMSHEIRTPLNGILGAVNLMSETTLTEQQRRYLDAMRTSGSLLLQHVNDVLDLSRLEANASAPNMKPFQLEKLITSLIDSQRPNVEANGNSISSPVFPSDVDWVVGDSQRLQQILLNFISNAAKFTDHGSVTVETHVMPDSDDIEIQVIDTGMGISDENLKRIFDEFVAIDATYGRRNQGTGLGLPITRRLAESLGGEVGAESVLGEGSTFWVRLPLPRHDGPKAEALTVADTEVKLPTGLSVLVIEDNEVNRLVLREMLTGLGHRVTEAEDGYQGVRIASREVFDIIFMDVSMPGMDGLEATMRIRQAEAGSRDAFICAVTAHSGREDHERMTRAGMDRTLTKPFAQVELLEVLRHVPSEDYTAIYDGFNAPVLGDLISNLGHARAAIFVHEYHSEMTRLLGHLPMEQLPDDETVNEIHRLAGSSAVMGADEMCTALQELEQMCKQGDVESYAEFVTDLGELERLTKRAQLRYLSRTSQTQDIPAKQPS